MVAEKRESELRKQKNLFFQLVGNTTSLEKKEKKPSGPKDFLVIDFHSSNLEIDSVREKRSTRNCDHLVNLFNSPLQR